jgi:hypothetical protein
MNPQLVTLLGENNPSMKPGVIIIAVIAAGVLLFKTRQGKKILRRLKLKR